MRRVAVVLLAVCACLLLAPAQAALGKRYGFNIGTVGDKDKDNVVKNGTCSGWCVTGDKVNVTEVGAPVQSISLVLSIDAGTNTQAYHVQPVASPDAKVHVALANEQGTVTQGTDTVVTLNMTCDNTTITPGELVKFTVNLDGFQDIVIGFDKVCAWPSLESGFVRYTPSIIKDGEPVETWTYTAPAGEQVSHFHMWLVETPDIDHYRFSIHALDFNNAAMKAVARIVNGAVAYPNKIGEPDSQIEITYNCEQAVKDSTSAVSMDIGVGFNNRFIHLTWQKTCGAEVHPRPGLNIHTTGSHDVDIAKGGVAIGQWKQAPGPAFAPNDQALSMILAINGSAPHAGTEQAYTVVWETVDGKPAPFQIDGTGMTGTIKKGGAASEVTLRFKCAENANATIKVSVQFEGYESIVLYLTKTCLFPRLNLGLNQFTDPDVMKDGKMVAGWHHVSTTPRDIVYAWLSADNAYPELNYVQTLVDHDEDIMNIKLTTTADPARIPAVGTPKSAMQLLYNCKPPKVLKKARTGQVKVDLDIGWVDAELIRFNKTCPGPSGGGGSDGWSGVGVFFFVTFLLVFAFCVGGCFYNYYKRDLRGAEVIPGYNLCREMVARARGEDTERIYTPQTDYSYEGEPMDHGGASYSTEL